MMMMSRPAAPSPLPAVRGWRTPIAVGGGVAAALALTMPAAAAHTGHPLGGAVEGLAHPVGGVDHLLAMVAVGVIAALVNDRRVAWLTPMGFLAGMIGGGLLGMAGTGVPLVELFIAASVIVLGALVLTGAHRAGWWVPVLAAMLGVVHGQAHGVELPLDATPLAYAAGFVVATAVLHVAGTALGLGLRRLPSLRVAAGTAVSASGVFLLFSV